MGVTSIAKHAALTVGLYPAVRWVRRHVWKREQLAVFKRDVEFFSQFIGPNDLVFDVGANIGLRTEVFLALGARVVAFEPQPDCMLELKGRLAYRRNLIPVQAALGSTPGEQPFYVRPHRGASGLLRNWEGTVESTMPVQVSTLDEMIRTYGKPRFCKIDVEGFEPEVLKGLSAPIPALSIEYHLRPADMLKTIECLDRLSHLGRFSVNVTPIETLRFAFRDWLDPEGFIEFFREQLPRLDGYEYGDAFIRFDQ
jgi:FkbM family methyltransferase